MSHNSSEVALKSSTQIHDQQFRFGHLLNCVAQPFAPKAGIFDSAIGHVVDAESGNIAGDQASHLKFVVSVENKLGVARK